MLITHLWLWKRHENVKYLWGLLHLAQRLGGLSNPLLLRVNTNYDLYTIASKNQQSRRPCNKITKVDNCYL